MEPGYKPADSGNLPIVDSTMVNDYFINNAKYVSAEIRNVKTKRAGRENYGDDAVGFVQLQREGNVCTLKAKVTPEHRIHIAAYIVSIQIDEAEEEILSCECHSCAAAEGGCKHAIAFLLWLHRRSEEPSVTSVTCYWRKAKLSTVGRTAGACRMRGIFTTKLPPLEPKNSNFFNKYLHEAKKRKSTSALCEIHNDQDSIKKISIHCLYLHYAKSKQSAEDINADDFVEFCKMNISTEDCKAAECLTLSQSKTTKWYEARYARITASKLYEASRCKTVEGVLVETIFGAYKIPETDAVKRGQELEDAVLKVITKERKIKIKKCGLLINSNYPVFGASPDGLNEKYCIEIKCPSKEKTVKNYLKPDKKLCNKPWAQIQLQMFLSGRKHGLFCVASPDFEESAKVEIVEVELNEQYCETVMSDALRFWKSAIFPILRK